MDLNIRVIPHFAPAVGASITSRGYHIADSLQAPRHRRDGDSRPKSNIWHHGGLFIPMSNGILPTDRTLLDVNVRPGSRPCDTSDPVASRLTPARRLALAFGRQGRGKSLTPVVWILFLLSFVFAVILLTFPI